MEESKHTKGTWIIRELFDGVALKSEEEDWEHLDCWVISDNNQIIADVKYCTAKLELGFIDNLDEMKANAKLIAAAPDLLEALNSMLNIFNQDLPEYSIGEITCNKAINAIKKATK